jgi:hypothetical protein
MTPTCNIMNAPAWQAWDPTPDPMATAISPGVGGGPDCAAFWIYERYCPVLSGYPPVPGPL